MLKAQILFWLTGATDGHAKNFSVFLRPGGSYSLTPLYDVLSAQPSLDAEQIERKQMKLAMSVGDSNHYRIDQIHARHFVQTAKRAGLPMAIVHEAIEEVQAQAEKAIVQMEAALPTGFPEYIHESVSAGMRKRFAGLASPQAAAD